MANSGVGTADFFAEDVHDDLAGVCETLLAALAGHIGDRDIEVVGDGVDDVLGGEVLFGLVGAKTGE